jgi:hypothetical protein
LRTGGANLDLHDLFRDRDLHRRFIGGRDLSDGLVDGDNDFGH